MDDDLSPTIARVGTGFALLVVLVVASCSTTSTASSGASSQSIGSPVRSRDDRIEVQVYVSQGPDSVPGLAVTNLTNQLLRVRCSYTVAGTDQTWPQPETLAPNGTVTESTTAIPEHVDCQVLQAHG